MKVRIVDGIEKSQEQREREVVEQYEKETEAAAQAEEEGRKEEIKVSTVDSNHEIESKTPAVEEEEEKKEPVVEDKVEAPVTQELDDRTLFEILKNKTGREINSYDDLVETKEVKEELPEDLAMIKKFQEETGRSLSDYMELQRDFDSVEDNAILKMYEAQNNPELSSEDIDFLLDDTYGYDPELEEDRDIRRKQLSKKKKVQEARQFFNESKEKYKAPLESRAAEIPTEKIENAAKWEEYNKNAEEIRQANQKKAEVFSQKTNDLFSNNFEGFDFEFKIGDESKKFTYKVDNADEVKSNQMNVENFIKRHVTEEDGTLRDAKEYHRDLFTGMNSNKVAQYFYELGAAQALESSVKESKNIDMKPTSAKTTSSKNGLKVQVVPDNNRYSNDGGLKFRT